MVSSNHRSSRLRRLCLAAVLVVVSSAFAPTPVAVNNNNNKSYCSSSSSSSSMALSSVVVFKTRKGSACRQLGNKNNNNDETTAEAPLPLRRTFLKQLVAAAAATTTTGILLPFSQTAMAGLLDDFGSDPSKIVIPEKKEEIVGAGVKKDVAIDPTLKGSYYYPTAKKRYLPRIQKVTANIDQVPQFIANGQWDDVQAFSVTAENAILPLQLYVSSLDGQGLSLSNSYAKVMKKDALYYEEQFKVLQKALQKKDKELALSAVQEMGIAVADYRQAGRLSDDDGNIPSVDEIKRSTMRRMTQAGFALDS